MKWIKRLFAALAVILLLLIGAALVLRHLSRSRPDWYPSQLLDEASRSAAARSVEDKLIRVQNWAQDTNANERNRRGGLSPGSPGYIPAPDPIQQISFSEAELNAFFLQWDEQMHWKGQYSQFVDDPVIALADDCIILAANVKELDTFVSVYFRPSLDPDGKLRLTLMKVMGGKLPLPRVFWSSYRQKLANAVAAKIEQSQKTAAIADDGSMNHDAMVAGMNELLLHALHDEPAEPVLFLRHDNQHSNAFPVRVTHVSIADKNIDLTVVPLNGDERKQLLENIRAFGQKPLIPDN